MLSIRKIIVFFRNNCPSHTILRYALSYIISAFKYRFVTMEGCTLVVTWATHQNLPPREISSRAFIFCTIRLTHWTKEKLNRPNIRLGNIRRSSRQDAHL